MNITFFISCTYGGGAERVTCSLASYLAQKGHRVEILVMSESEKSYPLDPAVTVTPLLKDAEKKNGLYNNALRVLRLRRYLRRRGDIDHYVVMLPRTTLMLLMLRGRTRAKITASERVDPATYPPKLAKQLRRYAKRADGFVFQTRDAMDWYGAAVDGCQTEVIPNAINPEFIRAPYRGARKKRIVAAGRLNKQKNFGLLIRAFHEIADRFPDVALSIFGEGEEREDLERRIASLGLKERVILEGRTDRMAQELEQSSLFVLSSDFEGMPNALMEAMASGLPCISTDCPCGGPRFLIRDGENGLLVPVGDEKAMVRAMETMLGDPDGAWKMGRKAEDVKRDLAPEVIYGQWEAFLNRLDRR